MLLNFTDDDLSILILALVSHEATIAEGSSIFEPHSVMHSEVKELRDRLERRQHFEARRNDALSHSAVAAFEVALHHGNSCPCACCKLVGRL